MYVITISTAKMYTLRIYCNFLALSFIQVYIINIKTLCFGAAWHTKHSTEKFNLLFNGSGIRDEERAGKTDFHRELNSG